MPTPSNDQGARRTDGFDAPTVQLPVPDPADLAAAQRAADELAAEQAAEQLAADDDAAEQTLLEQMGGISGLVYSTLPVAAFVPANSMWGLTVAICVALGIAAAILVWRLVRKSPIQPAISGFFGVGVCAFVAYRTGSAKGFFLFGIWASLLYAGVFAASLLVRWPLAGLIWGALNGHGTAWHRDKRVIRLYDVATVAWVVVFAARYLVQSRLYDHNATGLLAITRIGMGWPLTGVALLITVWAVRRAERYGADVDSAEQDPAEIA